MYRPGVWWNEAKMRAFYRKSQWPTNREWWVPSESWYLSELPDRPPVSGWARRWRDNHRSWYSLGQNWSSQIQCCSTPRQWKALTELAWWDSRSRGTLVIFSEMRSSILLTKASSWWEMEAERASVADTIDETSGKVWRTIESKCVSSQLRRKFRAL